MSDSSSLVRCHHSCFRVDRGQGIAIRARSRGFVHIFFALAVFLGLSVWGISEVLRYVTETRQTAEQREIESLHRARRALINYAHLQPPDLPEQDGAFNAFGIETIVTIGNSTVTVVNNYPFREYELPCPDVFSARETPSRLDGIADYSGSSGCGRTGDPLEPGSWVGRFPWRSLSGAGTVFVRGAGGEDLRDSAKERLWYAVSPNLLPSTNRPLPPLNAHYLLSREDWLTVTDARGTVTVSNRVAALVIAPREQSDEDGEDGSVFRLFEDTPRSGSPTPARAAAAYLDAGNRNLVGGVSVFVNSDYYRAAEFGPESDANQTLDLLARIDIEDLVNAADGPPDDILEDVIEVLRAHLIQLGSLPDPAVFEEAAATVSYRLPGFSPPRERAVTMTVYGVTTAVSAPQVYVSGYVEIPDLFIDRGNQIAQNPICSIIFSFCNLDLSTPFDTFGVFVSSGGTTTTIAGFQIIARLGGGELRYAVRHSSGGGDLDIGTDSNLFSFSPSQSRVSVHNFQLLDANSNPAYGIVETTITMGVAVRPPVVQRGGTVVGGTVTLVGVGSTVEARPILLVDGDSLPPFFIWPGSSIAINALLDLDPKPPFNAAIAALETRYALHEESRVPEMLRLADPGYDTHLPLALFGERVEGRPQPSAPTFAEPVGGVRSACYTIESARARLLDEGELVMALAGPAIGYFRAGSLSRLMEKVTGERIEDSPIYGAGVLLPPGTVLRVRFDAGNIGDLTLPNGYSVCGDVSGGSLVVGGALGARSVPVRLRTTVVAEVLSGGGEPDLNGVERPGGARPGVAAIAGNTGFFPIHSIDDQFPQNFNRVNPFYRFEQFDGPRWARLSGETFGFFPRGADLEFRAPSGAVIRGAPIAPAGALDRAIATRGYPIAERPSDEFMLDLSRPQFFPPDTDYLIPGNAGNPINVTLGDGFVFPPNSFARLPENSQIVGTYATRGEFRQITEIVPGSQQVSVDYRSVLFTADVVFGGLTSMTITIGSREVIQVEPPSNILDFRVTINGVEYRSQFSSTVSGRPYVGELLAGYDPVNERFLFRNLIYRVEAGGVPNNLESPNYILRDDLTPEQITDLENGQGPTVPGGSFEVIVAAAITTNMERTRRVSVNTRHVVLPNGDDYFSGPVDSGEITLTLDLPSGAMLDIGGARLPPGSDQRHGFQLNVKGAVDVCADSACGQILTRAEEGAMLFPYAGIFVEPRKVKIPLDGELILPSETRMQFITHPLTHPLPIGGGERYEYRAAIGGVPEIFNPTGAGVSSIDRERLPIILRGSANYHGGDFSGEEEAAAPDNVEVYWDENDILFLPPGATITFSNNNEREFADPQSGVVAVVAASLTEVARRFCSTDAGEEALIGSGRNRGSSYLEVCDETPGSMHAVGFGYYQGIDEDNVAVGARVGNITVFRIEDIPNVRNYRFQVVRQRGSNLRNGVPPNLVVNKPVPVASVVTVYKRAEVCTRFAACTGANAAQQRRNRGRRYIPYPVLEESSALQRPTYAASIAYQFRFVVPAESHFYDDYDPNLVSRFPAGSEYFVPQIESDYVLTLAVSTDDLDVDRRGALRRNVVLRLDADAIVNTPGDGRILAPVGSVIDVARREIIPPFGVHSLESAGADAAWVSSEEVVGYVREDINLLAPLDFEVFFIGDASTIMINGRLREFEYISGNPLPGTPPQNYEKRDEDGFDFPIDRNARVTSYIRDNRLGDSGSGRRVVYRDVFNMTFNEDAPNTAGEPSIGFRDYPFNLRYWLPERKSLEQVRMSPGGQLYQSDFTENDLATKLAGLRVPRGSFLFSPRGGQTRAFPADLDASPGAPGRSRVGFEEGEYIFVPGGLTATYARVIGSSGEDVFLNQGATVSGEYLASVSTYTLGAIPGPAYIELYNPDQPGVPGFRLAGRDSENVVFMPARTSYARVAEILDNNNAEVVLRTTGQRSIASYFSPTQWDYRGVARRDLSSGIYRDFLPPETASLLENFPLVYAVAPECREQWRGTSGKECASLEGEGLEFLLEAGEEIPLPNARNVPRGHTRVQAAVARGTFVVDHLRLQSALLNSSVPRFDYIFEESLTVTLLQFDEDGRITHIDNETGNFIAHEDRLILRAPAGGFRARVAADADDLDGASSQLHSFEWGGDLTVNVGGYTGEFGDEGFVPAAVFNRSDSTVFHVAMMTVTNTIYTPTLFPFRNPGISNPVTYPHYQHRYRFPTSSRNSSAGVSAPALATLQDFRVDRTPAILTIRPPQQLALGAGTRAVEGGGVYFGPGSRIMVGSQPRTTPLISVIQIVGDFEPAVSVPNIDNDNLFQPDIADVNQFGDHAGPLNLRFAGAGTLLTGDPAGNPGAGLQFTRVRLGAGASLPPDFFTRHIPEIMLETRTQAVTVFGDEPIYRDISGFYSNDLDMQIELGSDLRAIDEITGETNLSRAGERINLKIGGGGGASPTPDSGEFFIDTSSAITMLPGYVWQGYLPAPGDYANAPVTMRFSADHKFEGRHLATIDIGRPALTIALPQLGTTSAVFTSGTSAGFPGVGEAVLKNSAGTAPATTYVRLNYDLISLGFVSTEYDRAPYDTNSAPREKVITLDGYFEPVAQALINSSSPHLNIWGGGLDRPEFLDADYEFGIRRNLEIGRDVMFSGIVNDGLSVVSRPAYAVTVEVESFRPGAGAPQRLTVTLTAPARDAAPTRNGAYAYLAGGASYEGVELQIPSSQLCPASANFGTVNFGTVPLLVEPDVPLAGSVRYARPRYDSAMVGGEDARVTIDFNLREYSQSELFYDSARRFAPAGNGFIALTLQVHHESTYPGDAFSFYDGVSGPVDLVTVRFRSNRPDPPSDDGCGLEPTYDDSLTLALASGANVEILVLSSCPSARNPGWMADFYFTETGGATIARARAPYDLGSPRGDTTVVFAYPIMGGEKNFSINPFGIPPGHDVFPASPIVQVNPVLSPGFQDTVFAVQYEADVLGNNLILSYSVPYYNAVLPPLSIAYHHTTVALVTDRPLNLPSIDTPRPGQFRGAAFEVRAEPADVIDALQSPNIDYVWGKNAPPPSFRLADQNHGLRVDLSSPRDVPLIGDMFVFLDRGYDPRHFDGELQTLSMGPGFKIEGYAALVSPLGASGNDDGARYAYAQRSEMFSKLFDSSPLRQIYDALTGDCGRGSCAALFNSPEWAAVLSGVVGLQAVNVDFPGATNRWRENIYFILPHDVAAIRADRAVVGSIDPPQPEITLSFSFPEEELPRTTLTALNYSATINLSDAGVPYVFGDYRSLVNGEAVVIGLRAAREGGRDSFVRFALTPGTVVGSTVVLADVRGGEIDVRQISIASSYTRLDDGMVETETVVANIPLADNPYAPLVEVTRSGTQPVTLLAGSLLYPHTGRVIPAVRFPASGAIEIGANGARGAIDGAYRQPLPVGGVHGSRFGFYKGELAPRDVVSPLQDCFARVVKIQGRDERINVEGAYRVGDTPDYLTRSAPYYERTLPLLNAVELDYSGALSPTLTAALAMMDDSAPRMSDVLGNTTVTLIFTDAADAIVDLADLDIYESGSSPGGLLSGEDVTISSGPRRFHLRLGGSDSLRYFEDTSISVSFGIGLISYDLVNDSRYTGASFADLVFAYGAGINQRFDLGFDLGFLGTRDVRLDYDSGGLDFCSVTPPGDSCGNMNLATINMALAGYPQGTIRIDIDGLNRPLIVLRNDADGYSATINLANSNYYIAGRYSRLRAGFPVTVTPDNRVHQFEIAPAGGGRHIVRPLRPSHLFVYNRFARFGGNAFRYGTTRDFLGNVSLVVDLAADASYNTGASQHNAGASNIYLRLYNQQQGASRANVTAVISMTVLSGRGVRITSRLRVRGGRPGASRMSFCPPNPSDCRDVDFGDVVLRPPNTLPGVPSSVGAYSVFLPLPAFYLVPAITLTAFLPNAMTLTMERFLGNPTIYATGSSYPRLQSGLPVDLEPLVVPFDEDIYTVYFRLTPLGGLLSISYLITLPELLASGQVTFSVSFEENNRWCNPVDSTGDPDDGVDDTDFCGGPTQEFTLSESFNLFDSDSYYPLVSLTPPDNCFNENRVLPAEDYRTIWEDALGLGPSGRIALPTERRPLAFLSTVRADGWSPTSLDIQNLFVWAIMQGSRIESGQRIDEMYVRPYVATNERDPNNPGGSCQNIRPGRPFTPVATQTLDFDFPTPITVDQLRLSIPDGGAIGGYSQYVDLPPLLIGDGRTRVNLNDPAFYAPDPAAPGRPIFLTLNRSNTPNIVTDDTSRELNLLSGHEFFGTVATSDLLNKLLLAREPPLCDTRNLAVVCVQRSRTDENEIVVSSGRFPSRGLVRVAMSDLGFNTRTKTIPQGGSGCGVKLIGYSPANTFEYLGFPAGTIPTPTVYSCVKIVDAVGGPGQDLLFEHRLAENDQVFRIERFPYEPYDFDIRLVPASLVVTVGYPTYDLVLSASEDDPILTIDLNNPNFYLDGVVRPDFPRNERVALITLTLSGVTLADGNPQPQTLYLEGATDTVNTDFDFVVLPEGITIPSRFDNKISINSYVTEGPMLPDDRLVFIEEPIADREIVIEPGESRYVSEWHGGGNGPFLINSGANTNPDRYLRSQPPNPYSREYYAPALVAVPGTETRIATGAKTDFEPVRTWHFIETGGGVSLSVNSPDSFLGGDRMEDPGRREYEPVGDIYEMTADPAYWASAQPQLSHTRANYIVGGLDGFGDGLVTSVIQATVAILGSPATLTITAPRTVTVASSNAFANGRAFAIVDPRGEASQHSLSAVNYRTPYRRISPSGRKFLTRSQTPAMPLRDAFSSVPQYHNVWYRLRDDATYRYPGGDIPIRAGAIVNPVQGTYVNPSSDASIDAAGVNIRYYNRFGSLNSDLNLRQPAMILPAGAVYIVGALPLLPGESDEDRLKRLPRITNVQAAVFFSLRPLSGIGCELASEQNVFPGQPVQVVINQQGPKPDVLRNAASVAIRARPVPSENDLDNPDNEGLIEDAFVRYASGLENFTLGHPCEWLDEIENSDGDALFFYRSRDAIGGEIGARRVGNDRTYIMGGRIRFSRL